MAKAIAAEEVKRFLGGEKEDVRRRCKVQ